MTGLLELCPIWVTRFPIKRLAMFCAAVPCLRLLVNRPPSSRQAPPFLSCPVWPAPALTNYGGRAARMRI
jgi:hypothetical protein